MIEEGTKELETENARLKQRIHVLEAAALSRSWELDNLQEEAKELRRIKSGGWQGNY